MQKHIGLPVLLLCRHIRLNLRGLKGCILMSLLTLRKTFPLAILLAVSLLYFNFTLVTTFDGWQLLGVWIMLVSITGYERYINN